LPDDPAILKRMILELLATLHQERQDRTALRERIDRLLKRLYGPRGERFDPNQPLLFAELGDAADPAAGNPPEQPPTSAKRTCRPHGRRRMPEHLPREPLHHELPEAERICPDCGHVRVDIGVDRSEQLDYRPASLFVIEHFVHKYACPCCRQRPAATTAPDVTVTAAAPPSAEELPAPAGPCAETSTAPSAAPSTLDPAASDAICAALATRLEQADPAAGVVIAAPRPAPPIARGLPGPGLLAHLIVSKCVDHLPLHRLERVYDRQGLILPRSTTCDWLAACAQLLQPLYHLLVSRVLQARVLHTDDTPVKLQDPTTHRLSTARLWVYLGDAAHPYNVFDFTPTHQRDGPAKFLQNFQGYLQADAFSGYDGLYLQQLPDGGARIVEVACNAHARRKFYEARSSDALRSHHALALYGQLYEIERQARDLEEELRQRLRQDLAVPILEQFHTWLEEQRRDVLPKSPLGEALAYTLNNWTALARYTEAGCLAIDNNVAEREMKRIAIGRKNWLHIGSLAGGQTAAVLFSFTSTCQRLGVEPWAYLRDVLTRLPAMAAGPLTELLPDVWRAAHPEAWRKPLQ
jgi:transposase